MSKWLSDQIATRQMGAMVRMQWFAKNPTKEIKMKMVSRLILPELLTDQDFIATWNSKVEQHHVGFYNFVYTMFGGR